MKMRLLALLLTALLLCLGAVGCGDLDDIALEGETTAAGTETDKTDAASSPVTTVEDDEDITTAEGTEDEDITIAEGTEDEDITIAEGAEDTATAIGVGTDEAGVSADKYLSDNRDRLCDKIDRILEGDCVRSIIAVDGGFVISAQVSGEGDIDEAVKAAFDRLYDDLKRDVPQLSFITVNVSDSDGNALSTITVG